MIVAFCANGAQAGKSTAVGAAVLWARERELTVRVAEFSDVPMQMAGRLLGIPPAELEDWKVAGGGRERVTILMDAGRELIGADVWTRAVLDGAPAELLVIGGVRKAREAELIAAAGGVLVRIERPGAEPDPACETFPVDRVLANGGTLDDLRAGVRRLLGPQ